MMFERIKSAFGFKSDRGLQRPAKERGYGVRGELPPAFTETESIEKRRGREIEQQLIREDMDPEIGSERSSAPEDVLERAARRHTQNLRNLTPEQEHGDLRPSWAMSGQEREEIKQERERQERERREREIEEERERAREQEREKEPEREYDPSSSLVPNPAGNQLERDSAREKEHEREMEMGA